MEIIAAIVLVCGINLGNSQVGSGLGQVIQLKKHCQTELAKCMHKKSFKTENDLIQCMGERK